MYSHIVLTNSEKLSLRMEGDMSGRAWLRFCTTLKKLKGIVMHDSSSNSLSKLVSGKMPAFETGLVRVYENNKIVNRQYFAVSNFIEAVRLQILSVMEAGLFIPSSFFTKLHDESIILRFGGDKGGQFMKSKFGLTVMKSPFLNSPDNFEILGTLDAEDSPYNLKHGLFHAWVDDLNRLFDETNGLNLVVLKTSDEELINVYFCDKAVSGEMFQDLHHDVLVVDEIESSDSEIYNSVLSETKHNEKLVWKVRDGKVCGLRKVSENKALCWESN